MPYHHPLTIHCPLCESDSLFELSVTRLLVYTNRTGSDYYRAIALPRVCGPCARSTQHTWLPCVRRIYWPIPCAVCWHPLTRDTAMRRRLRMRKGRFWRPSTSYDRSTVTGFLCVTCVDMEVAKLSGQSIIHHPQRPPWEREKSRNFCVKTTA